MTNTALERAKEIKLEIDDLKRALSEITRGKFFDINASGSCTISRYGVADPFLAQVENEIKTYANNSILKKITSLEDEFKKL